METAAVIVISVLAGLACLRFVLRFISQRAQGSLETDLRARRPGVVPLNRQWAAFFGRTSGGSAQVRGNGLLVLHREELYFLQAIPRRELAIPLSRVVAADLVGRHLGKSVGRDLLRVRFEEEEGSEDEAAWLVRHPERWQRRILALARQAGAPLARGAEQGGA